MMLVMGQAHNENTQPSSLQLNWLYIDFNSYFASVEQQRDPSLRNRPIAVVPVMTDATCAIAASYEAKAFGIKTGTPIYEAKKRCPEIVCVQANHEHYVDTHNRIINEVNNHIPVSQVCSIDEVACKLMKNEQSAGQISRIAASIKHCLRENIGEYIRCSIGVAPNKYLAKVATDMQKPNGFTILTADSLPGRLLELKLDDLPGIGRNNLMRLYRCGIYDMHDFWNASPKHLRKVFGSLWGERMYYYLRGVDLPDPETTRSTIGHSHVLAPDLRPPTKARFVAMRLTLKAASRMRRIGYRSSHFTLSVRIEDGPRLRCELPCRPADDSFTFLRLLEEAWGEIIRAAGHRRIKKVSVTLSKLTESGQRQPQLFDIDDNDLHQREKYTRMSHALDKINQRFGRDSITVGMLPSQGRGFSGTKIAFTRIPDKEEFVE
ncbi:MAG: impB/mucB/samB family protein [Alphaproteobacteria bacterium]